MIDDIGWRDTFRAQDNFSLKSHRAKGEDTKSNEHKMTVEVVRIDKGEILAKSNGKMLTLEGIDDDVNIGDLIEVEIKGSLDRVPLQVKMISVIEHHGNKEKMNDILKMLQNLGIETSKESLMVLKDMNKEGIELTEVNVKSVFENLPKLNEFINVDPKFNVLKNSLLFMLKNKIDIDYKSIKSFSNMIDKNNFIASNLEGMIKNLKEGINQIENIVAKSKVLQEDGEKDNNNSVDNTNKSIDKNIETVDKEHQSVNDVNKSIDKNALKDNIIQKDGTNVEKQNNKESIDNIIHKSIDYFVDNKQESNVQNMEDKTSEKSEEYLSLESIDKVDEILKPDSYGNVDKLKHILDDTSNNSSTITPSKINELKKLSIIYDALVDAESNADELYRNIRNDKNLAGEIEEKKVAHDFKRMIDKIENVTTLVKKNNAKNIPGFNTSNTIDTLEKETYKLKDNLNLLLNINKYNTIFQIPININNNKSICELYVFNNDKKSSRKKINANNATMFLSLNTANIGNIEAYIKVVNKTVDCSFMTELKLASDIINVNRSHLSELLFNYGYTLVKATSKVSQGKSNSIFDVIGRIKKEEKKGLDVKV